MRLLIPLAIALAVLSISCGGDESTEGVASIEAATDAGDTETAPRDAERQLIGFSACMRDQGLEWPDPFVDASGEPRIQLPAGFQPADLDEIFDAAEECGEFLEGVPLAVDATDLSAATDLLLEFARCMRENGFDLPDPDFSLVLDPANAPPAGPFGDVDLDDADFVAAFENCDDIVGRLGFVGN